MIRLGWLLPPVKEGDPHSWLAGVGEVGVPGGGGTRGSFQSSTSQAAGGKGL